MQFQIGPIDKGLHHFGVAGGDIDLVQFIEIFDVHLRAGGRIEGVIGIHFIQQPIHLALCKTDHRLKFLIKGDDGGNVKTGG